MSSVNFIDYSNFSNRTFESFEDIFDPRTHVFNAKPRLQVHEFFSILKAAFTKENIAKHPQVFIAGLYNVASTRPQNEVVEELVTKILAVVPEEDLFALAFTQVAVYGLGRGETYVNYTLSKGLHQSYSNDEYFVSNIEEHNPRIDADYSTPEYFQKIAEYLTKCAKSWRTKTVSYETKLWHEYNASVSNNFVSYAISMLKGGNIYRMQNGDACSYTTCKRKMVDGGEGLKVSVGWSGRHKFFSAVMLNEVVTKNYRAPIEKLLQYSADAFTLLGGPLITKEETKPVLYGVELEVSTDYTVKQIVNAGEEPFLLAKADSSISGSCRNKMELVTRPMSLKNHKKQWAYFFSKLDYDKFDTSKNTNNGMHVHIDRTAFVNKLHLKKLSFFITAPSNFDFMFRMSERDEASLHGYAAMPNYRGGRTRNFLDAMSMCANIRGAVNLAKPATVEIRLFKGIVSYASLLKNLEFVEAALVFTKDQSISKLSITHFLEWLDKTEPNRYQVLKNWIRTNNIEALRCSSDILDIVGKERTPSKVIKLLRTAGFKTTQVHIDYMNTWVDYNGPGPVFELNEKGEVDLIASMRNQLAFMDRELEAKILRGRRAA